MDQLQMEALFRQWWAESYRNTPPNKQAASIAAAFALFVLQQHTTEKQPPAGQP